MGYHYRGGVQKCTVFYIFEDRQRTLHLPEKKRERISFEKKYYPSVHDLSRPFFLRLSGESVTGTFENSEPKGRFTLSHCLDSRTI